MHRFHKAVKRLISKKNRTFLEIERNKVTRLHFLVVLKRMKETTQTAPKAIRLAEIMIWPHYDAGANQKFIQQNKQRE